MLPELDTLDQLLGSDMPLAVLRKLYDTNERFQSAVARMLQAGDVLLLTSSGDEVPHWDWSRVLADPFVDGYRLALTPAGARRVT